MYSGRLGPKEMQRPVSAVSYNQLVARDEEAEVDARKTFYENSVISNEIILK